MKNKELQSILKQTKSIDEALVEISQILRANGLFGSIYLEDGVNFRVVDCSLSPYHAGALIVKSSAGFQRDYKDIGGEAYTLFRKGMYDAAKMLGATISVAEPTKDSDR